MSINNYFVNILIENKLNMNEPQMDANSVTHIR